MSTARFDGTYLTQNGSRIGKLDGQYIYDGRGSRVGKLEGDYICDGRGSRIGKVDGRNIYDGHGRRIATLDDVHKQIEGPGGASLAALWILFIR